MRWDLVEEDGKENLREIWTRGLTNVCEVWFFYVLR